MCFKYFNYIRSIQLNNIKLKLNIHVLTKLPNLTLYRIYKTRNFFELFLQFLNTVCLHRKGRKCISVIIHTIIEN